MSVVEGVARELERLPADLAESALGETARALAVELDGRNSATSKAMCAKALMDVMGKLRELAPADEEADLLDELVARRYERRAAA